MVRRNALKTVHPDALMTEITRLREELDRLSWSLSGNTFSFFRPHSLPTPKFSPPELGFLLVVSWLYVLYFEAGTVNVKFIESRFATYKLDIDPNTTKHVYTVGRIRTYLHHNLEPDMRRDSQTQKDCQEWMRKHCKTSLPESEKEWSDCLSAILQEAIVYLKCLKDCVREIERDESSQSIIATWKARRERYHPEEQFDELIFVVTSDLGYSYSLEDTLHLRKSFYSKWVKDLDKKKPGYDFSVEARKLIEYTLLYELTNELPITSQDIITELNVVPGSNVEKLLRRARILYDAGHSSREALLEQLKLEYARFSPSNPHQQATKSTAHVNYRIPSH